MKSDRLKKLEAELADLEQWLKLGLVPKNEIERHKDEITTLTHRIDEEKKRLNVLKESGDVEEYAAPKRGPAKQAYADTPTMSDVEASSETTEAGLETETMELETKEEEASDEDETGLDDFEDEDDPFSDKNRWKRGGIIDPDATEW